MGCCLSNNDPAKLSSHAAVDKAAKAGKLVFRAGFDEEYEQGKVLGSGNFASVYLATHRETGRQVAAKKFKKNTAALSLEQDYLDLVSEISVLRTLKHPNVVELLDYFNEAKYVVLIQELAPGGELYEKIITLGHYSERMAREYIRTLLQAMEYCHQNGVVHRDIKPENILLTSDGDDAQLKVCDFGFATAVSARDLMTTPCGTLSYMAPELLREEAYNFKVDCWSLGVVFYVLLCGKLPFRGATHRVRKSILKGKVTFTSKAWEDVSEEAKDFILFCLKVNPVERPSCRQMLKHPWLVASEVPDSELTEAKAALRKTLKKHFDVVRSAVRLRMSLGGSKKGDALDAARSFREAAATAEAKGAEGSPRDTLKELVASGEAVEVEEDGSDSSDVDTPYSVTTPGGAGAGAGAGAALSTAGGGGATTYGAVSTTPGSSPRPAASAAATSGGSEADGLRQPLLAKA